MLPGVQLTCGLLLSRARIDTSTKTLKLTEPVNWFPGSIILVMSPPMRRSFPRTSYDIRSMYDLICVATENGSLLYLTPPSATGVFHR